MSAIAGEPDHFIKRFAAEGGDSRGFAQRRLFGRYLGELLDEAVGRGRTTLVHSSAIGTQRTNGRWSLKLDDSSTLEAEAIVLAIGNQEPEALRAFQGAGERFIANPWGGEARSAVEELAATGGDALLVGTGLTMVDLVLSLDAAGHRGRIVALSRRGQAPRGHADFEPAPVEAQDVPHENLRAIWRWLRLKSAKVGWRAAVDSLRPHSHMLWQSLDTNEQRRFLRHARPWWDVHRHRIAPEVAATVARLVAEERLQIMAGRVVAATGGRAASRWSFAAAVQIPQRKGFAYAFNCTGPLHSIERTRDPLLRSILDTHQAEPDQLGIGLKVDRKFASWGTLVGPRASNKGTLLGDHCRAGHSGAGGSRRRRYRSGVADMNPPSNMASRRMATSSTPNRFQKSRTR